ncbi:MAG TPA: ABC transporter permease [Terriglobales bacterium]|jgi:predicted permease
MPDWPKEIRDTIASLDLNPAREAAVVEELSQHLRDRYDEMLAAGVSASAAEHMLRAELADGMLLSGLKATIPAAKPPLAAGKERHEKFWAGVIGDLHYGARLLARNPGFALVAILSLALGIGANTTIFQLLNAVRMRPLPVKDSEQLAVVTVDDRGQGMSGNFSVSHPNMTTQQWDALRNQQQVFSNVAAWSQLRFNLGQGGEARHADALLVSGNFFRTLELEPALGRLINPSDDYRGCGTEGAVISYGFWQREYGGRANVLGSRLTLDGHLFQIAGVTPASFYGVDVGRNFDVALPMCTEPVFNHEKPWSNSPTAWWLSTIGRMKAGVTLAQASAQLRAISPGIFAATLPPQYDSETRKGYLNFLLKVEPGATGVSNLRERYESPLWLLLALSGLVLLIACANLANLMLARASARQREMALRLTLGASRSRLVRQLLAESLLLAGLGTISGLVLAQVLGRALISFLSTSDNPLFVELPPDWRVLGFAAALAILTCVLFGLTPAIQSARTNPGAAMKAGGRSMTEGRERFVLRRILVIAQVAFSLALLTGALLFVRTFRNLSTMNAGFQQDHILVADFDFSPLHLPSSRRTAYKKQLLAQIRAVPGVSAAGETAIVPLSGSGWNDMTDSPANKVERKLSFFDWASPGYFQTMELPLLAGRDFSETDSLAAPRVAIVNESFAKVFFPGVNPIGQVFRNSGVPTDSYQVVGLVKDSRYRNLRESIKPIAWFPVSQNKEPDEDSTLMIRSDEPLLPLIASIKRAAEKIDPAMALEFHALRTQVQEQLIRERLMATLSGFFGILAAILATIGLYGVISYMVIRRRTEIGIRMALGANRGRILTMVLREAGVLVLIGVAIGIVISLAVGAEAKSLLYGLKPTDPATLLASILGLCFVAVLATLVPARRAATVHPMVALREE